MPANSKQGTYLGTTLAGFTALPAGLYTGGGSALSWLSREQGCCCFRPQVFTRSKLYRPTQETHHEREKTMNSREFC